MELPLLKVPFIPLKLIMSQMELLSRIDLSFMSPYFKDVVVSLAMKSPECNVRLTPKVMDISVSLPGDNQAQVMVIFRIDRVSPKAPAVQFAEQKVRWTRSRSVYKFRREKTEKDNFAIFDNILSHLWDLFKLSSDISVILEYSAFNGFLFTNWKQFESLTIFNLDLSPEQAHFIFDGIETKNLVFRSTSVTTSNGPRRFPLKHRSISLESCNWLDFSSILSMDCEELSIGKGDKSNLEVADLSEFVRMWATGELKNLKQIDIQIPKMWLKQDISNGYKTAVYNTFPSMDITVLKTIGHEQLIQRSDGKQASVSINLSFVFKTIE